MDPREKELLLVVTASKPIPNQTITVSPRLHAKRDIIAQKLVSVEGKKAAANLLRRFGGNQDNLWLVDRGEFKDLDHLLTGVVFGW